MKTPVFKTPRINHQIKIVSILIIFLSAISIASAAIVRADGYLTAQEQRYGDAVSGPLCEFIDNVGINGESMTEAVRIIYVNTPSNMDVTDAVDIINYVVDQYCPRHWPALAAFGDGFRNGQGYA